MVLKNKHVTMFSYFLLVELTFIFHLSMEMSEKHIYLKAMKGVKEHDVLKCMEKYSVPDDFLIKSFHS